MTPTKDCISPNLCCKYGLGEGSCGNFEGTCNIKCPKGTTSNGKMDCVPSCTESGDCTPNYCCLPNSIYEKMYPEEP